MVVEQFIKCTESEKDQMARVSFGDGCPLFQWFLETTCLCIKPAVAEMLKLEIVMKKSTASCRGTTTEAHERRYCV